MVENSNTWFENESNRVDSPRLAKRIPKYIFPSEA